jgi:hypothetical protein
LADNDIRVRDITVCESLGFGEFKNTENPIGPSSVWCGPLQNENA